MAIPIDRPSKIICAGLNYAPHAAETSLALPEQPLLFAKWPNALIGPDEAIVLPDFVTQVDYEAELAVVIGSRGTDVGRENAYDSGRVASRSTRFARSGQPSSPSPTCRIRSISGSAACSTARSSRTTRPRT
jgi:hypothetical protein